MLCNLGLLGAPSVLGYVQLANTLLYINANAQTNQFIHLSIHSSSHSFNHLALNVFHNKAQCAVELVSDVRDCPSIQFNRYFQYSIDSFRSIIIEYRLIDH